MKFKKLFLTIGGNDPSGGAGILADIRTAHSLGLYPCAVVTSITAQNSMNVDGIWPVPINEIEAQLSSIFSDLKICAVKIGLMPTPEIIIKVAAMIEAIDIEYVVVDPVLSPTLNKTPSDSNLIKAYAEVMFPLANLVTPNIPEKNIFEQTTGKKFEDLCNAFLLKGGHAQGKDCIDRLYFHNFSSIELNLPSSAFPTIHHNNSSLFHDSPVVSFDNEDGAIMERQFIHKRIETSNTHGSGCILSSAIACFLAKGYELYDAVNEAIHFTDRAIQQSAYISFGKGKYGPALY